MSFSLPFLGAITAGGGLLTQVWPSANTVVSGSVSNAANVYDQGPTTYSESTSNSVFTYQTWGAVTPTTATLYLLYAYTMTTTLHGTASVKVEVSLNNGTTYTDILLSDSLGNLDSTSASGTAMLVLDPSTDLSQVKVKVTTTSTAASPVDLKIYQSYIQY